jgi:hypothetical protein
MLGLKKSIFLLKGKDQFCAGDIETHTNVYAVTNPELVICNMEKNVILN